MRAALLLVLVSMAATIVLAPGAQAGSIEFELGRIQYHRGDILTVEGDATPNGSVHVQVYNGERREYSNYSTTNATGYWIHALRVNASWPDGSRLLLVTDLETGDFWKVEIEVVPTAGEIVAGMRDASDSAWSWAASVMAASFIVSTMLVLVALGWAAFKVSRLSLREELGILGAAAAAWRDRWWWQLTMTLHPDGNYAEGTPASDPVMRRENRRIALAQRDIAMHSKGIEAATKAIRTAEDTLVARDQRFKEYVERKSKPAKQSTIEEA